MPRLHKLRRRQKFQYNVNRKLLNKKREKLPRIKCDAIRKAWDEKKSLNDNLTSMGLIADTNAHRSFKIPSGKQQMMPLTRSRAATMSEQTVIDPSQSGVASVLEEEAKTSFKSKKAIAHPLPKEMVKKLTGWLDKYGEDYDAMTRDFGNYNQETSAQIRSQVSRLKKVPQQWVPYLKRRGLLPACDSSQVDIEIPPC